MSDMILADLEDCQSLAKAIVTSMLADPVRHLPGARTQALLASAAHGRFEDLADPAAVAAANAARTRAVVFLLGDISCAAIRLLTANGIDCRGELASPYLMPEDF